jgi:hypothetical protein
MCKRRAARPAYRLVDPGVGCAPQALRFNFL